MGEKTIDSVGICLIVSTMIFIVTMSVGPQSLRLILQGEMFRTNARGAASSTGVFFSWFFTLIVGFAFPPMQVYLKEYVFLPFTAMSTLILAFLVVYLPETKGYNVNEIAELFEKSERPWAEAIGFKKVERHRTEDVEMEETPLNTKRNDVA